MCLGMVGRPECAGPQSWLYSPFPPSADPIVEECTGAVCSDPEPPSQHCVHAAGPGHDWSDLAALGCSIDSSGLPW